MAISTAGSNKKCATCQFFDGLRRTDAFGKSVVYEATAKGSCGAAKRVVAAGAGGCARWEKWNRLK